MVFSNNNEPSIMCVSKNYVRSWEIPKKDTKTKNQIQYPNNNIVCLFSNARVTYLRLHLIPIYLRTCADDDKIIINKYAKFQNISTGF